MKINELTKIEPSKTVIPALAKKLTQGFREGHESAVELSTKLDFVSKVCTEAKNELKEATIKEITEGEAYKNGYKLEVKETGVSYDYSNCNDPVLEGLEAQIKELKKQIDTRQKFLKSIPYKGMQYVNPETGEELLLRAPSKKSGTSPVFTLSK